MGRFNKGQISAELADYQLKKIGAAQEGLGVAAETITPGKGLGVAKRETVKLFNLQFLTNILDCTNFYLLSTLFKNTIISSFFSF